MTALLSWRRLDVSAAQSVDDLAKVKQIPEAAQIVVAIADIVRRRAVGLLGAPIGPLGRNERPAAIGQDYENEDKGGTLLRVSTLSGACVLCVLVRHLMG